MSLTGRSLISLGDLSLNEIGQVLGVAEQMAQGIGFDDPALRSAPEALDRLLATCFFEPSTRTRMSFASAMLRLGGQVVDMGGAESSSAAKGETLADTARIVSAYCDVIVQRHPLAGSARVAARYATVPVINAGDGAREHPTQTLTDLFCLRRAKGRLDGLRIGLCGDLRHGRTVHSLAPVMAALGSELICIAPPALQMPPEVLARCEALGGTRPGQTADLAAALRDMALDALYMTRVQKERLTDPAEYERLKGAYVLDAGLMALAPEDMIVLHPLPRVDEIAREVDADPRARYFEQAAGGVPVRMALLALVMGVAPEPSGRCALREPGASPVAELTPDRSLQPPRETRRCDTRCTNPRCITGREVYLPAECCDAADGTTRCAWCESALPDS